MSYMKPDTERPGHYLIFDSDAGEFAPVIPILVRPHGKGA